MRTVTESAPGLRRHLNARQLTVAGVGTILGAGIYALIGEAAAQGGEYTWLSFVVAAVVVAAARLIAVARTVAAVVALVVAAGVILVLLALALPFALLLGGALGIDVHDALVVLGVLQVVLGHHPVARCRRIAGKLGVFVGDMLRVAADLHIRPVTLVIARKGIRPLAVAAIARTSVLLSRPHWLFLTVVILVLPREPSQTHPLGTADGSHPGCFDTAACGRPALMNSPTPCVFHRR